MDKEQLVELIRDALEGQLKSQTETVEELRDKIEKRMEESQASLQETVAEVVQEKIAELSEQLDHVPYIGGQAQEGLVIGMPYRVMQGGLIQTAQGSIINPAAPNPWMVASPQMTEWCKAFAEYHKSKGKIVPKLLQEQQDPEGGYLVPEEFEPTIVMYEYSPTDVWPRATVWPMSTDKLGMPALKQKPSLAHGAGHFAGVSFSWIDEGAEKEETEPKFEFIELICHELSGYTEITNTLLEDTPINLLNFLTRLYRQAWLWQTEFQFINGNGVKKPLGVIFDPGVIRVRRQTAGTVQVQDILNMDTALHPVFENGAVWFMSKEIVNALRGQTTTTGALVLVEHWGAEIAGGIRGIYLLGYPVIVTDGKTPVMGVTGDVILGNWMHYYIGDRRRFTLDTSEHYRFRHNRTAVRMSSRLDGQPAIPEAFVILDAAVGTS